MTTPLVSIVIPSYNAAPWLPAAIDSALAQTHSPCEIIVVDDGSTDDSLALASRYSDRGVRIYSQPHHSAARARNRGLAAARGEFIQFLDADDFIAPEKIARQLARLAASPPLSVASSEWACFTREAAAPIFSPEPNWRDLTGLDFLRLHYDEGGMMPPIAWLAPRALLDAAGPWREDLTLNDDGEYFCRVLLKSAGIVFTPGARAGYRSALPGSLSRRRDAAALRSLFRSIAANTAALLAHENSPRVRRSAANAWRRLAYEIYPTLPAETKTAEARARELGGSSLRLEGGRLVRGTDHLFGWRAAARLKHLGA